MSPTRPYRNVNLGPTDIAIDRRPDGTILVRSPHELGSYAEKMTERLDHWARQASYRTFLAERDANGRWRNVTYAESQYFARRIAQALIRRDLSVERPIVILSGNDIEHALLGLGAMYAGVPYAPVSPAYSLVSTDFEELRYILKLLTPGMVFASDGMKFDRVLREVVPEGTELVVNENPVPGATMFADLVNTEPDASLDHAHSFVHADAVFKILFTPVSAGMPRGVIYTHRMWCSNQEQTRAYFKFLTDEPPVVVDGMPWDQTFGGNANLGLALYNGGTLYIDNEGSSHNLKVIAPTIHCGMPKGLEELTPRLRNDAALRKNFFSRLRLLYCGGPGLPQQTRDDLTQISAQECGQRVLLLTGLNSAETSGPALFGLPGSEQASLTGVPVAGMDLKLVPHSGGKFEARARGPNITWGYWRSLEQTRAALDDEGFFRLGYCLRLADEADPSKGFAFDGRLDG
jgi:feruloyl-CoA synthase